MSPKVEFVFTIVVLAAGFAYFGWRYYNADSGDDLLYLGLMIIGAIVAQRAIKDVLAKMKAPRPD